MIMQGLLLLRITRIWSRTHYPNNSHRPVRVVLVLWALPLMAWYDAYEVSFQVSDCWFTDFTARVGSEGSPPETEQAFYGSGYLHTDPVGRGLSR